jgi:transcription termination factor NusB
MKSRLLLITLGLLLICQSPLFAQYRPSDVSPVRVLKAALGLTEDQAIQLRELIGAHTAAVKDNKERIKLVQQQIDEDIHSDAPDPQVIGELVLMVSMLKQDIGQNHEDFQMAFRAMLTEEQLKNLGKVRRIALLSKAAEVLDHLKLH